ncbi:HAD family hydrolase [Sorangium sp. So ce1036]|uniref:HAD hydrolase family protein n=1 Tax=Sorangium sp. So ce1036 TaxID=3133328 RepID=UPI003F0411D4
MTSGPFRGVAFDLDGTLLRSDHSISQEMRSMCATLAGQGILVTLISSRPPRSVERIVRDLGLESPWAALNGAILCASGAVLDRSPLPEEAVEHILARHGRDGRVSVNLYAGLDRIVQAIDRRVGVEAEIVGFSPTVEAGFAGRPVADKILLITDARSGDGARIAEALAPPRRRPRLRRHETAAPMRPRRRRRSEVLRRIRLLVR